METGNLYTYIAIQLYLIFHFSLWSSIITFDKSMIMLLGISIGLWIGYFTGLDYGRLD